mmetsp:Transcript_10789/g.27797  ORF Transcript_10789/g.27797 Transcript_10789/m.27797 type:complete len:311 (-) Transcript_10789:358-1290(-)
MGRFCMSLCPSLSTLAGALLQPGLQQLHLVRQVLAVVQAARGRRGHAGVLVRGRGLRGDGQRAQRVLLDALGALVRHVVLLLVIIRSGLDLQRLRANIRRVDGASSHPLHRPHDLHRLHGHHAGFEAHGDREDCSEHALIIDHHHRGTHRRLRLWHELGRLRSQLLQRRSALPVRGRSLLGREALLHGRRVERVVRLRLRGGRRRGLLLHRLGLLVQQVVPGEVRLRGALGVGVRRGVVAAQALEDVGAGRPAVLCGQAHVVVGLCGLQRRGGVVVGLLQVPLLQQLLGQGSQLALAQLRELPALRGVLA